MQKLMTCIFIQYFSFQKVYKFNLNNVIGRRINRQNDKHLRYLFVYFFYREDKIKNNKISTFCSKKPKYKIFTYKFIIRYQMYIRNNIFGNFFYAHTKYCIIGGGTGGLNVSSHLLRSNVRPHQLRIFEPAKYHYYQPGFTNIGANISPVQVAVEPMDQVLPRHVLTTKQKVTKIDPQNNALYVENGDRFTYENLIVSTGFKYDWSKIKGAKQLLDDPTSNVCSIYHIDYAIKTRELGLKFKGGNAIFTEPVMPIKCAGAPQKILYLLTSEWRNKKLNANVEFFKWAGVMFGVPKYSETLTNVAKQYGIDVKFKHTLVEVTRDTAIFEHNETKERIQKKFDFLHIVPPMTPHQYIAESGLGDQKGFLQVDKHTCRHVKYQNIWGVGDCTSMPNSKTAAAVFSQTNALVENLQALQKDPTLTELPGKYDGYASCPLFVGNNKLMLAQFKYDGQLAQTFSNHQQRPNKFFYYMKKYIFPLAYWQLVPKGLWNGSKGIRWI